YSGDGGSATAARLFQPIAVAVDSQGTVYIADYANYAVRKVSGGTITGVAGVGRSGFTPDGGRAAPSAMGPPQAVAVDSVGSVYFTDGGRVRTIDGNGNLVTVVGGGSSQQPEEGTRATGSQSYAATGLTISPVGDVVYSDSFFHVV